MVSYSTGMHTFNDEDWANLTRRLLGLFPASWCKRETGQEQEQAGSLSTVVRQCVLLDIVTIHEMQQNRLRMKSILVSDLPTVV